MTLQQLKYVVTVAETGMITEVADRLYISQTKDVKANRSAYRRGEIRNPSYRVPLPSGTRCWIWRKMAAYM